MAARSSTTILAWGGSAMAGAAKAEKPAKASARTVLVILVSCGGAEVDDLGSVIIGFSIRQAEVDLNRAEGRFPGHADAGRAAEGQIVLHAGADAGILRAGALAEAAEIVEPAHGAEVGEQRKAHPIAFGQQGGKAHLRRADGAQRAAQGAGIVGGHDVARADAGKGKTAETVAAVKKTFLERHQRAVIAGDIAEAAA